MAVWANGDEVARGIDEVSLLPVAQRVEVVNVDETGPRRSVCFTEVKVTDGAWQTSCMCCPGVRDAGRAECGGSFVAIARYLPDGAVIA